MTSTPNQIQRLPMLFLEVYDFILSDSTDGLFDELDENKA
jgi:hypothetical protein